PFQMAISTLNGTPPPQPMELDKFKQASRTFWKHAAQHRGRATLVDPSPWFCDESACAYKTPSGEMLYRDSNHLSLEGARFVARNYMKVAGVNFTYPASPRPGSYRKVD